MCLIVKLLNHISWNDFSLNILWLLYLLFIQTICHRPWVLLCDLAGVPRIQIPDHSSLVSFWGFVFAAGSLTAATAKSLQLCLTLRDPIDGSPPGSSIPGILQARTLEWVAISFSNAWKWKVKVKLLSRVQLLGTPWTAAYQAPPPMGLSRQEYWSGLPLPSPSCMFRF